MMPVSLERMGAEDMEIQSFGQGFISDKQKGSGSSRLGRLKKQRAEIPEGVVFEPLGIIEDDHRMAGIGTVNHRFDMLLGPGNEGNTSAFGLDAEGFGEDTGYAVSGMPGIGDKHGAVGVFVEFMDQGMDKGGLARS